MYNYCMSNLKNIAVISLGRKGAGPLFGLVLAEHLKHYYNVLLIYSNQSEISEKVHESGLDSIGIDTYNCTRELVYSMLYPIWILKLISIFKHYGIRRIFWPMMHPWTLYTSMFTRNLKPICVIHDVKPHKGDSFIHSLNNKAVMNISYRVIVLTRAGLNGITNTMYMKKTRIARLGLLNACREKSSSETCRKKEILFFGRIEPYKNIGLLLDIYERVHKTDGSIKMTIAGYGDMSLWKDRIAACKGLRVINRWIENDELCGLFGNAALTLLPYSEASQSGIIPISYEFNTPVIASKCGGIPEQIENGKTGFVINTDDIDAYSRICTEVLNNSELADNLRKGITEYKKKHSWEKIIMQYVSIINE